MRLHAGAQTNAATSSSCFLVLGLVAIGCSKTTGGGRAGPAIEAVARCNGDSQCRRDELPQRLFERREQLPERWQSDGRATAIAIEISASAG
jgi:hypothetical protein